MAACIHLQRCGLQVLCIEPREHFAHIVGESLDWSAPQLLAGLGLPMEHLVAIGAATFKRHIKIKSIDGGEEEYQPGPYLAQSPWNVELRTLHLDRQHIHKLLQEKVRSQGTETIHDRVIGLDTHQCKIRSLQTSSGRTIQSRWVIDASGAAASVLGREFNLPSKAYGPRKIALWAHFNTREWVEGTTLYTLSSGDEYMEWLWEIPVCDGVSSVGYVAPGLKAKLQRASGMTNAEVLATQMAKFPRLRNILQQSNSLQVAATSFLCRTYRTVSGPNWIIIGEAASQSDPITGNGVTAALRHADEASALICRYQYRDTLPTLSRFVYNLRVSGVGFYFNSLIEKLYYEAAIRSRLGLFLIADIYTIPAWLTNLVYTRTRPRGLVGTLVLCGAMITLRGAAWGLYRLSNFLTPKSRRQPSRSPQRNVVQIDGRKETPRALLSR